jgi:hypothetical protein
LSAVFLATGFAAGELAKKLEVPYAAAKTAKQRLRRVPVEARDSRDTLESAG